MTGTSLGVADEDGEEETSKCFKVKHVECGRPPVSISAPTSSPRVGGVLFRNDPHCEGAAGCSAVSPLGIVFGYRKNATHTKPASRGSSGGAVTVQRLRVRLGPQGF